MTSTLRIFRTLGIATTLLLSAAAAAPQSNGHEHRSGDARVHAQDGRAVRPSVMEQIATLDKRIQMLSTDMRMLSGEMKVDAMASLLTALVERQSLMESGMRTMREGRMREGMMRRRTDREPPAAAPEEESGGMCAPN